MKKLSGTLCALLIVLCSAGFASALPYEYYSGYQSVNEGSSYSFYFDLVYSNIGSTNSSLKLMNDEAIGYVPLQSAFVKVALYSNDWGLTEWESAKISLTAYSNNTTYTLYDGSFSLPNLVDGNSKTFQFDLAGSGAFAAFSQDPWGSVSILANITPWYYFNNNDFAITEVGVGANPVPEPATMLLLGLGLVGLVGFGRKKFNS